MTTTESPQQIAARLAREARIVATDLPFDERADLVRELVKAVRDAVKFDPTIGGAPEGQEWELEGLGSVTHAAEDYFHRALQAKQSRY